jgi:precorrin-6A/cobalt-precorrin-6A reductase
MILVMSGTEEGREIVKDLHDVGREVLTTVATDYGYEIFNKMGLGNLCLTGRRDVEALSLLLKEKNVTTLIDATHPYATQASLNAIEACKGCGVRYIRFQRSGSDINGQQFVHVVESVCDAVEWCDRSDKKRILLTTGFSHVKEFIKLRSRKEIFVRILPMATHIEKCMEMGIPSSNILALQGPFSLELNKAIFNQYKVEVVITKESGKTGGVPEKVQAAGEVGIDVVVIKRHEIAYPIQCSTVDDVYASLDSP